MKLLHSSSFLPSVSICLVVPRALQASGRFMSDPLNARDPLDALESEFNEECQTLSIFNYNANPFQNCNPPVDIPAELGSEAWTYFNDDPPLQPTVDLRDLLDELQNCGIIPVNDRPEFFVSYEENGADGCPAVSTNPTTTTTATTTTSTDSTTTTTTTIITTTTAFTLEASTTETKCGPDITDWLVNEMNTNKNHPVIKTNRDNDWAMWIPGFNIGWHAGFLIDFKNLVKAGAVWDYKASQDFSIANCPQNCPDTVTLCGICFFYDVPGNIHYGWVGRAGRIRAWFLHNRAAAAQAGGVDDPKDTAAINIGINLWDGGGGDICAPIRAAQGNLATRDCPNCDGKFPLAGNPK